MTTDDDRRARALHLVAEGCRRQAAGEIEEAIGLYRASLEIHPTADAHTYLGWAYSLQGKLAEAIAACELAISIDPDFGNPYNDIGVYLMQQGQVDEAVPWLEKAKLAPRYEPRHFPYLNLGRIYAGKGMLKQALTEFRGALALQPDDTTAAEAVHEIEAKLN
jgi:Tfp pilus assembly protein PilF